MAADTVKIKLNKFGLRKTVSVKITMSVDEKMTQTGIETMELQDTEGKTPLENAKNAKKAVSVMTDFIQDIFNLSDEEISTIKESISSRQFAEAFDYVTYRLQGISDDEYELEMAKARQQAAELDPKEESVESEG